MKNIIFGAVCFSLAVGSSTMFAFMVFKLMDSFGLELATTMIERYSINIEVAFICVMILVLWAVDLVIRPLINDLIQSFLKLWRDEDDGRTTATTAKTDA